jgi:hypothetical protein
MKNFWTQENLNKLSQIMLNVPNKSTDRFKGFLESWTEFCEKFKIKPGSPDFYVKKAYYGQNAHADRYDFEEVPIYYEWKNTVVIKNPFYNSNANELFIRIKFLELDADLARKFLVLGLPY